jgi:hypothetical protein
MGIRALNPNLNLNPSRIFEIMSKIKIKRPVGPERGRPSCLKLIVAMVCTFQVYSMGVRMERKILWLVLVPMAGMLLTGCGGINASHSVSPASFFLPGLGEAKPVPAPSQAPSAPANSDSVKAES